MTMPTRYSATALLVGANLALFSAIALIRRSVAPLTPTEYVAWGSNWPPASIHQPWRLITALFLQHDVFVLALTCLALIVLGRWAEQEYGARWTLLIYLASGAVGSVVLMWSVPQYQHIGAGAALVGLDMSLAAAGVFARQEPDVQAVKTESLGIGVPLTQRGMRLIRRSLGALPILILAFTQQHGSDIPAQLASGVTGLALGAILAMCVPQPQERTESAHLR